MSSQLTSSMSPSQTNCSLIHQKFILHPHYLSGEYIILTMTLGHDNHTHKKTRWCCTILVPREGEPDSWGWQLYQKMEDGEEERMAVADVPVSLRFFNFRFGGGWRLGSSHGNQALATMIRRGWMLVVVVVVVVNAIVTATVVVTDQGWGWSCRRWYHRFIMMSHEIIRFRDVAWSISMFRF